jgi:hypothetical protein
MIERKINDKIYKSDSSNCISNLRIVSMLPSDSQELLDDFHFSNNLVSSNFIKQKSISYFYFIGGLL